MASYSTPPMITSCASMISIDLSRLLIMNCVLNGSFWGRCRLWPGDERDHTCLARLFIFLLGRLGVTIGRYAKRNGARH